MNRTELLKIAKPILFNTEMVKAILDGRKTVTRRVVKPQPTAPRWNCIGYLGYDDGHGYQMEQQYKVGDILYVRETFCKFGRRMFYGYRCYQSGHTWTAYKSDKAMYLDNDHVGNLKNTEKFDIGVPIKWRPSIHMPKEAARIFLKVTDVRVERLQDMNEYGAEEEGVEGVETQWLPTYIDNFIHVWNSTIKKQDLDKYGWNANPWVWVYEFERINNNENNNN